MEVTDEQIEDLVALGYDLHIHDKSGYYPGRMNRDEWEASEKAKILGENAPQPGDASDSKCPVCGGFMLHTGVGRRVCEKCGHCP